MDNKYPNSNTSMKCSRFKYDLIVGKSRKLAIVILVEKNQNIFYCLNIVLKVKILKN